MRAGECLTGPPFLRDSEVATIYAHLHEEPAATDEARGAGPPVEAVAIRAIAKRPDDRFSTAGEMAGALRAHPGSAPMRRRTPGIGKRVRGLAAAAAGLAIVVGVVAFVLSRGEGDGDPQRRQRMWGGPARNARRHRPRTGEPIEASDREVQPGRGDRPKIDVGSGSIWIAGGQTGLFGVELDSGDVTQHVSTDIVVEVLVADRLVWSGEAPGLAVVDPAVAEIIEEIRVVRPEISINPQACTISRPGSVGSGRSSRKAPSRRSPRGRSKSSDGPSCPAPTTSTSRMTPCSCLTGSEASFASSILEPSRSAMRSP